MERQQLGGERLMQRSHPLRFGQSERREAEMSSRKTRGNSIKREAMKFAKLLEYMEAPKGMA